MAVYLPIMLDCRGRRCLVVGGGAVAVRKIRSLLEAQALVTVVSPALAPGLEELAAAGAVDWRRRAFAPGDTAGAWLVFAATGDREVNAAAVREAKAAGIPVSAADDPEAGDFISPAVVRRGRLTVAVSTSGAGPGAAAGIAAALEDFLGEGYEPYLDWLHRMRSEIKRREPRPEIRRKLLRKLASPEEFEALQGRDWMAEEWSPEQIEAWMTENREE
ncbi:precorrin-2 dehydrogenase/sirohydrochlorin ferrochelatase family protein [Paenibacillus glufosinatiresistens]|uniref:precorrin-2 dehydrogenase/sirohydrochlorin ferrochelatase family protein n=1 Tax=Paenibacillus glufosinatiresistens TaxID=3070657 RepID=UPI00286D923E|nr:bifunctional precorrin-2 dehydrogenase/sirohydrochlorin ferrochelatase [Paenibacillus sp. YX.27]